MPAMGSEWCKCCTLSGRFSCSEDSMDFKLLMTDVGLSLLLFPDPDPEIPHDETTTVDPKKLDGETEKLYKSWRSRMEAEDVEYETQCKRRKYEEEHAHCEENGLIDMSCKGKQLTKGRQEESELKEQHVQALFREQMNKQYSQQPVALFSNLHPGPRIAYAETSFGQKLVNILENNPQKKTTLLEAFNVPKPESPEPWRTQVNRTRREMDLVMVVYSSVIEVEVKSGTNVDKAVNQMKWFCKYMGDFHGPSVKKFNFLPIVAKSKDVVSQTICNDCQLDIDATATDFESWLHDRFESLSNNITATSEECKSLIKRLLLVSSLVLTSLPAPSEDTDLNLILLRESQWNFLSARPPFAVIHGDPSTGKSTALELGLAFILPNGKTNKIDRYLASFVCIQNVQYRIRQKFFASESDITLYAQEEGEEEKETGKNSILKKVMSDIEDKKSKDVKQKCIICIDNVPKKDLWNPELLKQLALLKENCQHLWIVMEDKLSVEDQREMRMLCQVDPAPTFLLFE